ncbi:MAG: Gx transporter family protein [Solobacterium sp.]|nr:Gx transporter family protein [Solobacterium sp.]
MNVSKTKHFVYLAMLCAMAITLSLIESIYIGSFMYGIRIGLANIIALITIHIMGIREMVIVNIMRVVISTLMRGLIFGSTFWISLGGVALSSIVLIITYRLHSSVMFSSVLCAIAHSVGQVIVVVMFYMQPAFAAILPYLLVGSVPMGIMTGIVAQLVLSRIGSLQNN